MTNLWEKYKEELWWSVLAIFTMSGYLLYYLNIGQNLWIYAFVVLVVGLAILKFPQIGLYVIFFCTLIFERHFTLQTLVFREIEYKLYPLDIVILIIVLSIFLKFFAQHNKEENVTFNKFDFPIFLFGLSATLSFVYALLIRVDPATAFGAYKNYFLYAIIYFITLVVLKTKEDWEKMMFWITLGAGLMFYFLGYGLLTGHGLWSEYTPLSTAGERLIAGTHAFYFMIFGFWLTALYFWKKEEKKLFGKKEILIAIFLILAALLVSLVRHLWLALILVLLLWLIFLPSNKKNILYNIFTRTILTVVAASVIFIWLYGLFFGDFPSFINKYIYVFKERASIVNVVNLQDESFRWRISAWIAGLSLWQTSPVWGIGLGHQIVGYDELFFFDIPPRDLHNNYLGIFIQMGILGILAVICWFIYLLNSLQKTWLSLREKGDFNTQLFFIWGNTVILFMIVFSISVYWDINLFVIWWWLSLAAIRFLAKETENI